MYISNIFNVILFSFFLDEQLMTLKIAFQEIEAPDTFYKVCKLIEMIEFASLFLLSPYNSRTLKTWT